jgi:hypothetical protein
VLAVQTQHQLIHVQTASTRGRANH